MERYRHSGFRTGKSVLVGIFAETKRSETRKNVRLFSSTIANKLGKQYSKGIRIKMKEAFKDIKDVVFTEQHSSCDKTCYREENARLYILSLSSRLVAVDVESVPSADGRAHPGHHRGRKSSSRTKTLSTGAKFPSKSPKRDTWKPSISSDLSRTTSSNANASDGQVLAERRVEKPAADDDAFHLVMKELERKKRGFKSSTFTF